ncbi:outer membrane beta-barrel protein [Aquimarina sp. RZ0]|uniref:outer membrane beta-barrel protein n=1 Tax=Aquimarina sp. RZ0 TaxID=2607730 RepID=UPI0011F26C42|nr:outer membrane beta-barrel protein [Aquimarina sp. RZ0]KAA1244388.1 porin family protein [Aquimarina sp. RZ0]
MKKLLLFTTIAVLGVTAMNAQVKFGFGLGYAAPLGDIADFTDGGIAGHAELGYGITDNIDVSLYYQGDFLIGADIQGDTVASFGNVTLGSFMLNGRYFFKEDGFRPYGSLGIGITSIGSIDIEGDGQTVSTGESSSNFSFRPAIGFKYKVLNFNVAYLSGGKSGEASVGNITANVGLLFTFGGK